MARSDQRCIDLIKSLGSYCFFASNSNRFHYLHLIRDVSLLCLPFLVAFERRPVKWRRDISHPWRIQIGIRNEEGQYDANA